VRIALGIEHDGAGFNGWQTQPTGVLHRMRLSTPSPL
jgi:tRNA U38,U39,U40 pseudouridine synthase TruA